MLRNGVAPSLDADGWMASARNSTGSDKANMSYVDTTLVSLCLAQHFLLYGPLSTLILSILVRHEFKL